MDCANGPEETTVSGNRVLGPAPAIGSTGRGVGSGESLVDLYLNYSKDLPSPIVFRLWTAIHAVGAATERRVWTNIGKLKLYPNLFVFLVGPPGVGKTVALSPMGEILRKSGAVGIAPNDLTKQGLLDALSNCKKGCLINGVPFDYAFMALHISELSNFMDQYDTALAGLLTALFDCEAVNEEQKRGKGEKSVIINNPGISFVMGTATQNLGNTISDNMWGSGFMARVIMVHSADKIVPKDMFAQVDVDETTRGELEIGLRRLGEVSGPMGWTDGAQDLMRDFRLNNETEAPIHNRLTHYTTRRWMHLCKLCMIAALSDERMTVEADDFLLALSWLVAAEVNMTEIFKDMQTHSDGQIHEELRSAMFHIFSLARRPIHHSLLAKWLSQKVASHQVPHIIAVALAAEYFIRVAGTHGDDAEYIPQGPKSGKMPGAL